MSHSISFYLRRQKYIYCTITISSMQSSKSTGIIVPDSKFWDGRYYRDPRQKKESERINDEVQSFYDKVDKLISSFVGDYSFTPSRAFEMLEGKPSQTNDLPFTFIKACWYYIKTNKELKGWADNTTQAYEEVIKKVVVRFIEQYYGAKDIPLNQIRTKTAKDFKVFLNDNNYSNSTQIFYMGFCSWTIKNILEDYPPDEYPEIGLYINPFNNSKLKPKKKSTNLMEFLRPDQEVLLWNFYDQAPNEKAKDQALLCLLMWNSGLSFIDSNAEYAIIKDINLGEIMSYTRDKTEEYDGEARVIIYDDLRKVLNLVAASKDRWELKYDNHLPVYNLYPGGVWSRERYRQSYQYLYRFLREFLEPIFGRHITPHMFRHSFAVKMLDYGHSMDAVRTFLGHTTITTTEKYYGFVTNTKLLSEKNRIQNTGS